MKKKLLLVFSILFVLPFTVKAVGNPNVTELDTYAEDGGNIILFGGSTENSSHAVMCKLYNNQDEEIDKLSVKVTNDGTNGTFGGSFLAPSIGTYTVACANYEGGTIVTDSVTVEEMVQLAVEFNTNGGSQIEPVNVIAGQTIDRPQDPTKEGKVFGGWYEDQTLTTPFDFSTRIKAFVTIYAKWNDPEEVQSQTCVQIIYDGGGAYQIDFDTDSPENQGPMGAPINHSSNYFVDPETEVTLTAIPSEGHHLAGWYATHEEENPNDPGHMIWVEDGLISNSLEYTFTPEGEYINIKLVFEENAPEIFTVTFNTNGGSEISPIDVEAGHTIERPRMPEKEGYEFIDWYADDTLTTLFDFNTEINENTVIYAKWHLVNGIEYEVTDENGNVISFEEVEGQTFNFTVFDCLPLTDEELEELGASREDYNFVLEIITDATKDEGTILAFYEIEVNSTTNGEIHDGPFEIKIKITDEMNKYDTIKLIYVRDDFTTEDPIVLTKEGDYLVGTLPHLSKYVLVGSNSSSNPATFDNIFVWINMLIISAIGILLSVIMLKFKKSKAK